MSDLFTPALTTLILFCQHTKTMLVSSDFIKAFTTSLEEQSIGGMSEEVLLETKSRNGVDEDPVVAEIRAILAAHERVKNIDESEGFKNTNSLIARPALPASKVENETVQATTAKVSQYANQLFETTEAAQEETAQLKDESRNDAGEDAGSVSAEIRAMLAVTEIQAA